MPVPDYQTLLLPLLKLAGTGQAETLAQADTLLSEQFRLSEEDRAARLPSGQQTVMRNRVGWASFYLKNAGLIEKPKRGYFRITPAGRDVLGRSPDCLTLTDLLAFPEFQRFYRRDGVGTPDSPAPKPAPDKTPDETLQSAYAELREDVESDILDRLLQASPEFFENVVVELLVAMGYGGSRRDAGERIGKSGDGGIDGIIKEDKLGLDTIYIQAKRWQGNVGRPDIQKFVGALQGQRARKGVFMTTSGFSSEAIDYVSRIDVKVVLLDGRRIARLMFDHDIGVSAAATFVVKKIDSDYFEDA